MRRGGGARRAGDSGARSAQLLKRVHELERETCLRTAAERARIWNELGRLAGESGEHVEAQRCMGRAIDAYLDGGFYAAAAAMCRRLLRSYPDAVRVRSTLAFLAIGSQAYGDARQAITDYVAASRRTSTERYAIPRLHLMAAATEDAGILCCIGTALEELGDVGGREAVLAGTQTSRSPEEADPGERWERLMRVAILTREQLPRGGPAAR